MQKEDCTNENYRFLHTKSRMRMEEADRRGGSNDSPPQRRAPAGRQPTPSPSQSPLSQGRQETLVEKVVQPPPPAGPQDGDGAPVTTTNRSDYVGNRVVRYYTGQFLPYTGQAF
jgi:hypothetical protein